MHTIILAGRREGDPERRVPLPNCYFALVPPSPPRISVVVPAYNAAAHLPACLSGLKAQDATASTFEVIVVDDHSTDSSTEIAGDADARLLQHDTNRGAAAARNTGAKAAKGAVLLFLDSDVIPDPGLITATLELFPEQSAAARVVTGRYSDLPANDTAFARYKSLWTFYCWQRSGGTQGHSSHIQGALTAITAPLFDELGGFDETYCGGSVEDYEFSLRLREAGQPILFDDRITGRHHFPGYRTCARNYWDRARMWTRLAPQGRRFSSGQANPRAAAASLFALGSALGHAVPLVGLPFALASGLGYVIAAGPFLNFVRQRQGLAAAAYATAAHWSLSVVVGAAALSSPFGAGSRRAQRP